MSYTLGNFTTTDWADGEDGWKAGVDGNWKSIDWYKVKSVKKMIATVLDLPLTPSNGDAYMIGGLEVRRWNANTTTWDIISINPTANFLFYDEFTANFYSWVATVITVQLVTVLNTDGDMLIYNAGLQRLAIGNQYDILQVSSLGFPEWVANPTRSLKIRRPSFKRDLTVDTDIIVPASLTSPQTVKIGNEFYTNTTDRTIDATTLGRNGLDVGALAVATPYYVYAIPPLSGTTFDLVLSADDPNTGPTGFPDWSYLGSTVTNGSSVFELFRFVNGRFQANGTNNTPITVIAATPYVLPISTIAHSVQLRLTWAVCDSVGADCSLGPTATDLNLYSQGTSTTESEIAVTFGEVIIETPQTIYASLTNSLDEVNANVFGWSECPEDFN